MKKIIPLLLICLSLMALTVGYAYNIKGDNVMHNEEEEKNLIINPVVSNNSKVGDNISKNGIEMTTEAIDINSDNFDKLGELEVVISNNTLSNIYADRYYSVEYYNGNSWAKVPLDFGVKDIQVILPPDSAENFSINIHPTQYDYKPGKYRICKTVVDEEGKKHNLTAEFTIK